MTKRFPDVFSLNKLPEHARRKVDAAIALLKPARVVLVGGSEETHEKIEAQALEDGEITLLNQDLAPGCTAFCTGEDDAARVPVKYVVRDGAIPLLDPKEGVTPEEFEAARERFAGDMSGKTMYVLPWRACHHDSPLTSCGLVITDSAALVMLTMTMFRCGVVALEDPSFRTETGFSLEIHSKSDHKPESRVLVLDRENQEVWVRAYDYPGASLVKKNVSMRLAGFRGLTAEDTDDGFVVEHAALLVLVSPEGVRYGFMIAAPSACGKTSNATLDVSQVETLLAAGWRVETVGDDHIRAKVIGGQFRAYNPEHGAFAVADDTNWERNPNVMKMLGKNTNFLNVGLTADGRPTWKGDGLKRTPGDRDWLGNVSDGKTPLSHPNGRFTSSLDNLPTFNPYAWKTGVGVDHFMLATRRTDTLPLLRIARDWQEFLFYYATLISEKTAAEKGTTGGLVHDPGATRAFLAYPVLLHVDQLAAIGRDVGMPLGGSLMNVFRKRADGSFAYPGYAENLRLMIAALDVQYGRVAHVATPTGLIPSREGINLIGLDVDYEELFHVDTEQMRTEYGRYEQLLAEQVQAPKEHFLWDVLRAHKSALGIR